MAEPPFGQIKQARGFRQLRLRGLEKVRGEWMLICLTHHPLKLHRAQAGAWLKGAPARGRGRWRGAVERTFLPAIHPPARGQADLRLAVEGHDSQRQRHRRRA